LVNRAIIVGILHRNRKWRFYGVFHRVCENGRENRSPIWVYFLSIIVEGIRGMSGSENRAGKRGYSLLI
jgi:hypothetical protein